MVVLCMCTDDSVFWAVNLGIALRTAICVMKFPVMLILSLHDC